MSLVDGSVAQGFESAIRVVAEAAQLVVTVAGETVVDVVANLHTDALMTVYSSTKGLAAFATAALVDAGQAEA